MVLHRNEFIKDKNKTAEITSSCSNEKGETKPPTTVYHSANTKTGMGKALRCCQ